MPLHADDIEIRLRPGEPLLDKYRVIRILGQGGMGVVVAARDIEASTTVAIKLMLAQAWGFGNAVERFVREARAAGKLTSENVAAVLDAGELEDGTPYIVMEYLEGMNIADLMKARGPFAVPDAMDVALQACAVMAEAHALGVIHRDIKPGNLFVAQRPDGAPLVKVLDFGLSKLQETPEEDLGLTETMGTMGSPAYMSPEQSRSAKYVDTRTDIWSLGVTIFLMLSGRMPFEAESRVELFAKILKDEPSDLAEFAPWVPARLVEIIERTMVKDPDQRFQTMGELATELSAYASEWGRAFCHSPTIPIPWPVAEPAISEMKQVDSTVEIEGPPRLNLAEFLGGLPTRIYDVRSITNEGGHTSSRIEPRRSGWRRGLIAVAVMVMLGTAAATWFVSRQSSAAPDTSSPGISQENEGAPPRDTSDQRAPDDPENAGVAEPETRTTSEEVPDQASDETLAKSTPDSSSDKSPDSSSDKSPDRSDGTSDESSGTRSSNKRDTRPSKRKNVRKRSRNGDKDEKKERDLFDTIE